MRLCSVDIFICIITSQVKPASKKITRINNSYTREKYARLTTLVANNNSFLSVSNVSSEFGIFEISQAIYHNKSKSSRGS